MKLRRINKFPLTLNKEKLNMTPFVRFKEQFDAAMNRADPRPKEMLFLRYEGEDALPLSAPDGGAEAECRNLVAHYALMDDCQNYAVEHGVTSTYIFFSPAKYGKWLAEHQAEDSIANRAKWAESQTQVKVDTGATADLIWFLVLGEPDWYKRLVPPYIDDKKGDTPTTVPVATDVTGD